MLTLIIFRYLSKEVLTASIVFLLILTLIFLSSQCVHYLSLIATGRIPANLLGQLILLELPNLIGLIFPLAFYLAALLIYSRLYTEQELPVLHAHGFSRWQLLKNTFMIGIIVSLIVASLMLWLNPHVMQSKEKLLASNQSSNIFNTFVPKHFQTLNHETFYVEKVLKASKEMINLFMTHLPQSSTHTLTIKPWQILVTPRSELKTTASGAPYFVLYNGQDYQGSSKQPNYQITRFTHGIYFIPTFLPLLNKKDLSAAPSQELWPINNSDGTKAAELQWRLSIPLMTLILTVIVIPLAYVAPRKGRYVKLVPAILLYLIYANLLFIARNWITKGKVSPDIGIWWVHLVFIIVALALWIVPTLKRRYFIKLFKKL